MFHVIKCYVVTPLMLRSQIQHAAASACELPTLKNSQKLIVHANSAQSHSQVLAPARKISSEFNKIFDTSKNRLPVPQLASNG